MGKFEDNTLPNIRFGWVEIGPLVFAAPLFDHLVGEQ
jgi:hypothetical protein